MTDNQRGSKYHQAVTEWIDLGEAGDIYREQLQLGVCDDRVMGEYSRVVGAKDPAYGARGDELHKTHSFSTQELADKIHELEDRDG